jgi:hypothetical protein
VTVRSTSAAPKESDVVEATTPEVGGGGGGGSGPVGLPPDWEQPKATQAANANRDESATMEDDERSNMILRVR